MLQLLKSPVFDRYVKRENAGGHWGIAAAGFLITVVLLPLLSVLAVCVTKSKGVYDIGKPLGATFAVVFMVLIHFTIGPFFGTP
ncbi:branched-chain amino acid transport system II carrier protein, partial [Lactiplantibacillus plantarum]|uniref:branched-chain amino acid transport system II carrier protein n=3 Tax=Lactiplantibacillus plantarum TaxID=1590 RepID=UPI0023DECBBE